MARAAIEKRYQRLIQYGESRFFPHPRNNAYLTRKTWLTDIDNTNLTTMGKCLVVLFVYAHLADYFRALTFLYRRWYII